MLDDPIQGQLRQAALGGEGVVGGDSGVDRGVHQLRSIVGSIRPSFSAVSASRLRILVAETAQPGAQPFLGVFAAALGIRSGCADDDREHLSDNLVGGFA